MRFGLIIVDMRRVEHKKAVASVVNNIAINENVLVINVVERTSKISAKCAALRCASARKFCSTLLCQNYKIAMFSDT